MPTKLLSLVAAVFLISAAVAQPSTDIWLFTLADGSVTGQPKMVTDREGYDNQPQFGKDILYYTTQFDGQTDIWAHNISTGKTYHITDTPESEYSPTPTPDGNYVSVIMVEKDSTQRLWKYHLHQRKRELVLIDLKPVGYHVWYGNYDLGVFVLGETNDLYIANGFNGRSEKLLSDIGRSLNPIPGQTGHFSFVKNYRDSARTIMATDGYEHLSLINLPDGTDDFAWLNDSTLVTGVDSQLLKASLVNQSWTPWVDLSEYGVKNISRIAFDRRRDRMALVVER